MNKKILEDKFLHFFNQNADTLQTVLKEPIKSEEMLYLQNTRLYQIILLKNRIMIFYNKYNSC